MSRQDKATTDKNTRTLRELVKRPENKLCADCKRNDPRWASWNLGVFLCIRCSGIHRGMGTHISKVKSVDLDVWTPEQMESILKWGNRLANLYWEAHLKPGHVPPEHKMESFVRSKYESRRWALDGPLPTDPSVLDTQSPDDAAAATNPDPAPAPTPFSSPDPIGWGVAPPRPSQPAVTTRQPQARHQLISANMPNNNNNNTPANKRAVPALTPPAAQPQPPPQPKPEEDLFTLDFHAPAPAAPQPNPAQAQSKKQDILSLFNAAPAQQPGYGGQPGFGGQGFGAPMSPQQAQFGVAQQQAQFGVAQQQQQWQQQQQQQQPAAQSMMGTSGTGMWGAASGWSAPQQQQQQQTQLWGGAPANGSAGAQWGAPTVTGMGGLTNTAAVWGAAASPPLAADPFGAFGQPQAQAQKKDDAFGDLWGGFK
ncbi:hypothetical protein C8J57DRAFT_1720232 [Mycena rebaudengoi]|nr:hypothetical protein C8J57DRAFT_1720232 [Mycena rebaudengoi]